MSNHTATVIVKGETSFTKNENVKMLVQNSETPGQYRCSYCVINSGKGRYS